jgi:beta-glucanase (GH16 family)
MHRISVKLLSLPLAAILFINCNKDDVAGDGGQKNEWEIEGWEIVWHDEFDGAQIDLTKWGHEVNGSGGGNNELQYYTARPENSFVKDGFLTIQALKESYTGPDGTRAYTSARMRTFKKGDWKYGRFDIKARLPRGQGMWPAIWMLPTDWVYGGWAASGEIDIMELLGHDTKRVYGTLHYGGEWPANARSGDDYALPQGDFSSEFHVFRLDWEQKEIRWYVDDKLYQTQAQWSTQNFAYPAPFDQRFYMILNVAVGGNWPGNPELSTSFPQTMTVDYVRVYKRAG